MTDQSSLKCKLIAEDSEFGKNLVFDINDYENQNENIRSESFRIDSNTEFVLYFKPKYQKSSETTEWLAFFLYRLKSEENTKFVAIQYKIFIIDSNGQRKHVWYTKHAYHNVTHGFGLDDYVERNEILSPQNLLLTAKTLRIGFEIKVIVIDFDRKVLSIKSESEKRKKLIQNSNLSDVKFIVKGKTFLLHKSILSESSDVFKAMFRNDMKEQNTSEAIIVDIDSNVFQIFIEFLYLRKITGFESNAEQLLYCAEKYDISELKYICENTIANRIDTKNAINVLILTDTFHSEYLEKKSIEFLKTNSWREIDSEVWAQLLSDYRRLFDKLGGNISKN